jgi:hypothetical protein
MAQNNDYLKIYLDTVEAVRKNICSEEDQQVVAVFITTVNQSDSRSQYFHSLTPVSQVVGGRLRKIGKSLEAFAAGTSIPEKLHQAVIQYLELWYTLAQTEQKMFTAMRAARAHISPELRERLSEAE